MEPAFGLSTEGAGPFAGAFGVSGGSAPTCAPNAPIPEPGTWAAAALLVGGAVYMRWRKRMPLPGKRTVS